MFAVCIRLLECNYVDCNLPPTQGQTLCPAGPAVLLVPQRVP
jgi:hypothetical protein